MLDGDLAAIVLAQEGAQNGADLLPQGVAGDVVGYGEEDEGVEDDLDVGGRVAAEQRVRRGCRRHCGGEPGSLR